MHITQITLPCAQRYCLRALPPYLILHLVRFTKNNFLTSEKNRSVVTFPVKNLSLKVRGTGGRGM